MSKETRTISVTAYRDKAGKPCCASDFKNGDVCLFYRRFGVNETCVFAGGEGAYQQTLERRERGR